MTLVDLVVLLVVAAFAGAVGQALMRRARGGFAMAMLLGFVGALLGTWLARTAGLPAILNIRVGHVVFPLVWAILGAMLFVAVLGSMPGARARGGLGARARGGLDVAVSAPSRAVLGVSVVLAIVAMLAAGGSLALPFTAFAMMAAAYLVLLVGNLVRGA